MLHLYRALKVHPPRRGVNLDPTSEFTFFSLGHVCTRSSNFFFFFVSVSFEKEKRKISQVSKNSFSSPLFYLSNETFSIDFGNIICSSSEVDHNFNHSK